MTPPRMRTFHVGIRAQGFVQALDPQQPVTEPYEAVLEGIRQVAPFSAHVFVRPARPWVASEDDYPLDQRITTWERTTLSSYDLLLDHVPDAYVAQVVTRRQLANAGTLAGFTPEALPGGRILLTADDPEPWLTTVRPDPELLDTARAAFGDMLIAPELRERTPYEPYPRY